MYQKEALLGGRLVGEYFKDVDDFLKAEAKRIEKQGTRVPVEQINKILQDVQSNVHKARAKLRFLQVEMESRVGFWEEMVWAKVRRRNFVRRRLQLDTRLQIELGKVLVFYLRRKSVSLETIARLILLAYWAANLSEPSNEGFYKSKYTDRILKIRNIRDNLREATLHETATYLGQQPEQFLAELARVKNTLGSAIPRGAQIGALSLLYIAKVASRLRLTKPQIRSWIRTGQIGPLGKR
jgi:hypothetical protein